MPETFSAPTASAEELRQEIERLRLLHSIGLEFSASLDFDELLPRVFQRVLAALGARADRSGSPRATCSVPAGRRRGRPQAGGRPMPVGTGFIGDVAQRQRTTIVTRAWTTPATSPRVDSAEMLSTTVMATAMVAGGVTVGAIQVSNKLTGEGVFDERDRELLGGTGRQRRRRPPQRPAPHRREAGPRPGAVAGDQPRDHRDARPGPGAPVGGQSGLAGAELRSGRRRALPEGPVRDPGGRRPGDGRPQGPQAPGPDRPGRLGRGPGRTALPRDRTAPASDAERMFVTVFGSDLETDGVESGALLPLKDEEGVLGVLVFEAGRPEFANATQLRWPRSWPTRRRSP